MTYSPRTTCIDMERFNMQERTRLFEHYMSMDPTREVDRRFMENKCMSMAHNLFMEAQQLELLTARLREGTKT